MKVKKWDIFGGLTAGIVALPMALAFGLQSWMGAAAGLYGAIILGIIAALLGGTPTQVSGPTGPMTVVSATVVAAAIALMGNMESGLPLIIMTFVIAGICQVLFGVMKIWQYIKYIPYPVVSWFMTGIGVIIIILQIFPLLGHQSPQGIIAVLHNILTPLAAINRRSVILAILTIAIIYGLPKITKKIPSTLAALVIVTIVAIIFGFDVPTIGSIPQGLPHFQWLFSRSLLLDQWHFIVISGITLAALGSIDSLLTSVVADTVTKTKHNSNQELIGQGVGNTIAALFGGIPGAGATMRTLVNIRAGASTRLSGVLHGIVLWAILLWLWQYVQYVPTAVLAAILITVWVGIIDYRGIKHITHIPRSDAVIMIVVLLLTVFVDLIEAVGIGMVLAAVVFMKKMSDIAHAETEVWMFDAHEQEEQRKDEDTIPAKIRESVYIKHLYWPLFFGFTESFKKLVKETPDIKIVIFRMKKVPFIDQSGLYALEEAILDLEIRGIIVACTWLKKQPESLLRSIGIIPNLIPEDRTFPTMRSCVTWLKKTLV